MIKIDLSKSTWLQRCLFKMIEKSGASIVVDVKMADGSMLSHEAAPPAPVNPPLPPSKLETEMSTTQLLLKGILEPEKQVALRYDREQLAPVELYLPKSKVAFIDGLAQEHKVSVGTILNNLLEHTSMGELVGIAVAMGKLQVEPTKEPEQVKEPVSEEAGIKSKPEYAPGFGSRLALARANAGMAQKDLSVRANVSRHMVSKYETETIYPYTHTLQMLAIALGVESTWLASGRGEASPSSEVSKETPTQGDQP
ncbi:transcriptional repressor DicA [compost metagenome]